MATINNVQEDEPQLTALEKQMQVLTAAVERLTRQNRVLEEQLHRKAGNNIAEDLGDSSAEQRDREGPEGSKPTGAAKCKHPIPHRRDSTPCLRGDTGNEGADGGDDERSQGMGIQGS